MSPGSIERNRTPCSDISASQMCVRWRSAALLAPYAPHVGYALTAASLDMFRTTAPRPSRADAASAPSSAFVRRNGPSTFVDERALEILALGVAQKRERRRSEIRRVVDEDVEAAQLAENLQRHRVDVVFRRDVAHDAVRAGMFAGDLVDPLAVAGDERHARALLVEQMDEGQAESRRAAGDGDAKISERIGRIHF